MAAGKFSGRINIRELSRSLGVSAMTVYRVINDSPCVRGGTRDRVIGALNGLGYFTHRAPKKTRLVFDCGVNRYLDQLGMELMGRLAAQNYTCFLTNHRKSFQHYLNTVSECGFVVFLSIPDDALICETKKANRDIFTISIATKCSADIVISSNNTVGGELAADHLAANGHVRHVAVHLADEHSDRMERFKSFYAEMKMLAPDCRIDTFRQKIGESCENACLAYLETVDTQPSALFFLIGSYAQIFEFKVKPHHPGYEALSIISYDRNEDIRPCSELVREFDRIEFDPKELVSLAEYYILNRPMMKNRPKIHTYIDSRLVVKGSVKNILKDTGSETKYEQKTTERNTAK